MSSKICNVLVLDNHNHVGDVLCSLSLFYLLKKKYPSAFITFVAVPTSYPVPFFEINPFLDEVLIFDKSSPRSVFSFLKKLRGRKYNIGIVASTKAISRTMHILNFISGAKLRVGVKSVDGIKNKSHWLLNEKYDFSWKDKHQLERNADIAKQIGCDFSEEEIFSVKFSFSDEDVLLAQKYLKTHFNGGKKIIAFHPGAGKSINTWRAEKFIELIVKLYLQHNNHILITKGFVDNLVVDKISNELKRKKIKHEILYNYPTKKLGAILSQVDLFITNDTGTMHIAGFSGSKMISLFGPTNPLEWAPRGNNQIYIQSSSKNINDISVEEVLWNANKMLAGIHSK